MALFKCPQCGNQVSDKASKCPKCGADLTNLYVCPECGTHFPMDMESCPECGCPNEKYVKQVKMYMCPDCGNEYNIELTFCPECGCPNDEYEGHKEECSANKENVSVMGDCIKEEPKREEKEQSIEQLLEKYKKLMDAYKTYMISSNYSDDGTIDKLPLSLINKFIYILAKEKRLEKDESTIKRYAEYLGADYSDIKDEFESDCIFFDEVDVPTPFWTCDMEDNLSVEEWEKEDFTSEQMDSYLVCKEILPEFAKLNEQIINAFTKQIGKIDIDTAKHIGEMNFKQFTASEIGQEGYSFTAKAYEPSYEGKSLFTFPYVIFDEDQDCYPLTDYSVYISDKNKKISKKYVLVADGEKKISKGLHSLLLGGIGTDIESRRRYEEFLEDERPKIDQKNLTNIVSITGDTNITLKLDDSMNELGSIVYLIPYYFADTDIDDVASFSLNVLDVQYEQDKTAICIELISDFTKAQFKGTTVAMKRGLMKNHEYDIMYSNDGEYDVIGLYPFLEEIGQPWILPFLNDNVRKVSGTKKDYGESDMISLISDEQLYSAFGKIMSPDQVRETVKQSYQECDVLALIFSYLSSAYEAKKNQSPLEDFADVAMAGIPILHDEYIMAVASLMKRYTDSIDVSIISTIVRSNIGAAIRFQEFNTAKLLIQRGAPFLKEFNDEEYFRSLIMSPDGQKVFVGKPVQEFLNDELVSSQVVYSDGESPKIHGCSYYYNPVVEAVKWNNTEVIKALLDAGLDVKNSYRYIPAFAEDHRNISAAELFRTVAGKKIDISRYSSFASNASTGFMSGLLFYCDDIETCFDKYAPIFGIGKTRSSEDMADIVLRSIINQVGSHIYLSKTRLYKLLDFATSRGFDFGSDALSRLKVAQGSLEGSDSLTIIVLLSISAAEQVGGYCQYGNEITQCMKNLISYAKSHGWRISRSKKTGMTLTDYLRKTDFPASAEIALAADDSLKVAYFD